MKSNAPELWSAVSYLGESFVFPVVQGLGFIRGLLFGRSLSKDTSSARNLKAILVLFIPRTLQTLCPISSIAMSYFQHSFLRVSARTTINYYYYYYYYYYCFCNYYYHYYYVSVTFMTVWFSPLHLLKTRVSRDF